MKLQERQWLGRPMNAIYAKILITLACLTILGLRHIHIGMWEYSTLKPRERLVYLYTYSHHIYSVIQKNGLNIVRLYFLNYIGYVNDLHNT